MEVKRVEWLRRFRVSLIIPFILVLLPFFAFAGGGQHYPNGAEAMLIGVAPPPGFYLKNYFYFYTANKLKDNSGDTMSLYESWGGVRSVECLRFHSTAHLDLQS